jgi:hypothetical protein
LVVPGDTFLDRRNQREKPEPEGPSERWECINPGPHEVIGRRGAREGRRDKEIDKRYSGGKESRIISIHWLARKG